MIEREISGVLPVNKGAGMTSHDVVNKIRRLYGTKKVGHTGTLDPDATGVLVCLIGRAAKAAEYIVAGKKKYRAGLLLGITTDTEDISGTVLTESDAIPEKEAALSAILSFRGRIMQVPPMYSALKVDGHKLCELAREGKTVERKARPVEIYEISAEGEGREYTVDVTCSAGTYIRTLCADIGEKLSCGGAMKSLIRLETGGFSLSESHTLEELAAMSESERDALLIPVEKVFAENRKVCLPAFFARLAKNGQEIYLKKIGADIPLHERVNVYENDTFLGIGEVREYDGGNAVKIIKFL